MPPLSLTQPFLPVVLPPARRHRCLFSILLATCRGSWMQSNSLRTMFLFLNRSARRRRHGGRIMHCRDCNVTSPTRRACIDQLFTVSGIAGWHGPGWRDRMGENENPSTDGAASNRRPRNRNRWANERTKERMNEQAVKCRGSEGRLEMNVFVTLVAAAAPSAA